MTSLYLIRHGSTAWNEAGRMQGHTDVGLSPKGRRETRALHLPGNLRQARWYASPLLRAVHTAQALGVVGPIMEPRLMELRWGEWEGKTLTELRVERGDEFGALEARGLDFRPPGGESPRMVQARVAPWLAEIAGTAPRIAAVSHKGLIRAVYARATGWDFQGEMPDEMDWHCAHEFHLAPDGTPAAGTLNISLRPEGAPA